MTISGIRRLQQQLRRMPGAMREARSETLHEWADEVQGDAEQRVPERTGALHRSIDQRVDDRVGVALVGVWDQNTLEYARYVEQGTSSMREQPYLVPAFWQARGDVPATFRRHVREHLGRST